MAQNDESKQNGPADKPVWPFGKLRGEDSPGRKKHRGWRREKDQSGVGPELLRGIGALDEAERRVRSGGANAPGGPEHAERMKKILNEGDERAAQAEARAKAELAEAERLLEFNRTVESLIGETDRELADEYTEEKFPFHNGEWHTANVTRGTVEIFRLLRKTDPELGGDEDEIFAKFEAERHDIPQESETDHNGMRVRNRGFKPELVEIGSRPQGGEEKIGNEQQAADQIVEMIRRPEHAQAFEGISDTEVQYDIGATYPTPMFRGLPAEICPEHLHGRNVFSMKQPYIGEKSPSPEEGGTARGLALGLADLAEVSGLPYAAGESNQSVEAGRREFREIHVGISREIDQATANEAGLAAIDAEKRYTIMEKMLSWLKSQEGFILGQRVNLDLILEHNKVIQASSRAEEIRSTLRNRYKDEHFVQNAQIAREIYVQAEEKFGSGMGDANRLEEIQDALNRLAKAAVDLSKELGEGESRDWHLADEAVKARYDKLLEESGSLSKEKTQLLAKREAKIRYDDPQAKLFGELVRLMGYEVG